MSKTVDGPRAECPRCGDLVGLLADHDCDGELVFDGRCPMCGEQYQSYTTHIQTCDAA